MNRKRYSFISPGLLLALAPYFWLMLFFVVPLLIIGKISLSESIIGQPPYTPLFIRNEAGEMELHILWDNFLLLWEDAIYRETYLYSLKVAIISTLLCLCIAYPMAYAIWRTPVKYRFIFLLLVMLPFWTSFLLRVYAWIGILKDNGLINNLLMNIGLIDSPLPLLYHDTALYIGIVYTYLPFMILPIYAVLSRLDETLLEAASDLGSTPLRSFFSITLPQSWAGIIAGSLLVFIPAVGEFVIPDLLGGPDNLMVGRLLWTEFFSNHDWPVASALAVIMLLLLLIPIIFMLRTEQREIS